MSISQQDTTVSDTLAVVKVLKKYSIEPLIKSILKEALESKSGIGNQPTPADDDTVTIPELTRNDQEYSR